MIIWQQGYTLGIAKDKILSLHQTYIVKGIPHKGVLSGYKFIGVDWCVDREIDEAEISALERRLLYAQEMVVAKNKKINQARIDLQRLNGGYQEVNSLISTYQFIDFFSNAEMYHDVRDPVFCMFNIWYKFGKGDCWFN